jgi:hypothetical protein
VEKAEAKIRETGRLVAQDNETLSVLLPELLSLQQQGTQLYTFGRGLADGCDDKRQLWQTMLSQFKDTPQEKRNLDLLRGFLASCAKIDAELYNTILDEAVDDDVLGEWFPYLESTHTIDEQGVQRLNKALDIGKAHVYTFHHLALGSTHESISDDDLAQILEKILAKEHGQAIAINILQMRFFELKEDTSHSQRLLNIGRSLLAQYLFLGKNSSGYDIEDIAKVCFVGDEGANTATQMCQSLATALESDEHRIHIDDYSSVLEIVAERYSKILLDTFVSPLTLEDHSGLFRIGGIDREFSYIISKIPSDELISWCNFDSEKRYTLILSLINPVFATTNAQSSRWNGEEPTDLECNPLIYELLDNVPNLQAALEQVADGVYPRSWTGECSEALQRRRVIFKGFLEHEKEEIRVWAVEQLVLLDERIKSAIEDEQRRRQNQKNYESFE